MEDAFKPVENWVNNGIKWLDDLQSFYRERAIIGDSIEKEYSLKLSSLSKKYHEKKGKRSTSLSVGDNPRMTPGSLESASVTTWENILNSTESLAKERQIFSEEIQIQVADNFRALAAKTDDLRKKVVISLNFNIRIKIVQQHVIFSEKLLEDREKIYLELKKSKSKYDEHCYLVESSRQKHEKSCDENKAKAKKAYHENILDMNNAKNNYIIAIHVANAHKNKYFFSDIPDILDSMQDINELRIQSMNSIWTTAANLEITMFNRCKEHLTNIIGFVSKNNPVLDSTMFVRHNATSWYEPPDFVFEPCIIWHDSNEMVANEDSIVFLKNKVIKSRMKLSQLQENVDIKRREIDGLQNLREVYSKNPQLGSQNDVTNNLLDARREVAFMDNQRLTFQMEVDAIVRVIGGCFFALLILINLLDVNNDILPHDFKPSSFTIPTNCDCCNSTIWGLARQGLTYCNYNCHFKCEMRVSKSCPGVRNGKKTKKMKEVTSSYNPQKNTMSSLSSSLKNTNLDKSPSGNKGSFDSPLKTSISMNNSRVSVSSVFDKQIAKVLYNYVSTSTSELSVKEGDEIIVLEKDDGSGWITARLGSQEGIVPTSYVKMINPQELVLNENGSSISTKSIKKSGPAVLPRRGKKSKEIYVKALYDYDASSEVEISIRKGDLIKLIKGDQGDGWNEGELNGVIGQFPASYVEVISERS
ncbi:uncharacterized protein T551_03564 [Pneumocystis jirovecii RU7]|uniref:Protein BZZ1 n=1 Tax=Pneumocystis jirovecii (strain RU7) TaxID=1408657 RepID=A0A0W4ZCY1_PNEJ7|nr:uncharacterized protein T551_03564 [Pneumocystis jirovecii RU7]KTW26265.1 hypothetical protein T551_03564 [Pneumocystis jirovecii RU7]